MILGEIARRNASLYPDKPAFVQGDRQVTFAEYNERLNRLVSALTARGFTGNPNLLFWETHADGGGPIRKTVAWFFYAFNHFTIDKVVSDRKSVV